MPARTGIGGDGMKHIICYLFGHRRRVVLAMPAFFRSDPDLFIVCKCDRCGMTWPEPAEAAS